MYIFSEDPPMKSKGHGLSVLLYNLFNGSGFPVRQWFSFMPAAGIRREDISWSEQNAVTLLDPGFRIFHRFSRVSRLWNHLMFFAYLPRVLRDFRRHPSEAIFIPIGASAGILYRIWLIQKLAKNPVWLYPVDDLQEISVRQNRKTSILVCRLLLANVARSAARIFAISDGLGNVFAGLSGKKAEIILPCFQRVDPVPRDNDKIGRGECVFVFTGGLSFLYNDSLLQFTNYLKTYARKFKLNCKVIVQTYSSRQQFDAIGFDTSVVEYRTAESRDGLYKTYREADAFVVPYSFDQRYEGVTTTSFPQKVAQLIQLGKPLVVFGPAYGSVVHFFKEQSLDFVITENTYEAFEHAVNRLTTAVDLPDLPGKYSDVYERNFSQSVCLAKLRTAAA